MAKAEEISPSDVQKCFDEMLTEQDLADALALSCNEFWEIENSEYDDMQERAAARTPKREWKKLIDDCKMRIFAMMKETGEGIPADGRISAIKGFMRKNDYVCGSGYWLKAAPNIVEAAKKLTDEEIAFICRECDITPSELQKMGENELYDVVYETMCSIEIAEIPSSDDVPESPRCMMASDIVTLLGNAIAMSNGCFDEPDEENGEDEGDREHLAILN